MLSLTYAAFLTLLAFTTLPKNKAKHLTKPFSYFDTKSTTSSESKKQLSKTWVVLVAGSNGWYNYRHQSDVCHAYHVVRNHGIPRENIITMMYDDIANNEENPYPGKIYNVPHGKNVYAGVEIDYSGADVTPENFLAVLSGNATAVKGGSGKVVNSTHTDRIFAYFTDHGGVGLVSFPDSVLTVKDLNDALKQMYISKRYEKIVFYMEACESGSMFAKVLPKNINVYAVTAANAHESSWGCYCDNTMNLPCLGDCFSVNWMMDSEKEDLNRETLNRQFMIVKKETNKSHVMHYGNLKIGLDYVAYYLGDKPYYSEKSYEVSIEKENEKSSSWPSREIYPRMLKKKLHDAQSEFEQKSLQHKIKKLEMKRNYLEAFMESLLWSIVPEKSYDEFMYTMPSAVISLNCFDNVIKAFHQSCFHFSHNSYALKYSYIFANLCNGGINEKTIIRKMLDKCANVKVEGIH